MLQEKASTSNQAPPHWPSVQELLQATIAHLKNIQYHHLHNQEELEMVKVQSLAMAAINDELLLKNNELQIQLALAQNLVDAKRTPAKDLLKPANHY